MFRTFELLFSCLNRDEITSRIKLLNETGSKHLMTKNRMYIYIYIRWLPLIGLTFRVDHLSTLTEWVNKAKDPKKIHIFSF